ncbi:MAG: OmpA family protein [Gammaproteobacteria bacterium]|nr:OmpA family protein [Gammaproteobacteria bacterium]NND54108.1 OmpA family protein [Gammaproteobacteria bacterium]
MLNHRRCATLLIFALLSASSGLSAEEHNLSVAETARLAAIAAGAAEHATDLLEDGEEELSRSRRDARQGKAEKAAERRARAARLFDAAELQAIQHTVLDEARTAIKKARAERAKRYAPRTLQRAEQLLADANAALVNDRTNLELATDLADESEATARLAMQIIQIARKKPEVEDLVLERAGDLWKLQAAAGVPQEADQDRDSARDDLVAEITRMRESEQRLSEDLDDTRAFAAALEDEIRLLDEQLGGATAERRELVMQLEKQARVREQLEQAKSLFEPDEADIFRQSDAIVARLTGLRFDTGSAKIGANYDILFAKVKKMLAIYPGASIVVEGHTDSKGSDRVNKRLSQNRAQEVVARILRDNPIEPNLIAAVGYGETRPIANNETADGRARNRRIDILIRPLD